VQGAVGGRGLEIVDHVYGGGPEGAGAAQAGGVADGLGQMSLSRPRRPHEYEAFLAIEKLQR